VTCQELVTRLSDYIDGALDSALVDEVERHVATCHGCHVVLDTTQCTILLARAARTTALAEDRKRQLLAKLEAACRARGGCQG
jgi:anti-sigma factor RsiW